MKLIAKQISDIKEPTIILEYLDWTEELSELERFISGKHETITCYGEHKEIYNVRLDKILYFEAVGELVFAYTKDSVYDVKMRLYQVEEMIQKNKFYRASKSVLLNVNKIDLLKPALNGRFFATMANGEDVLISRIYAKNIVDYIKTA